MSVGGELITCRRACASDAARIAQLYRELVADERISVEAQTVEALADELRCQLWVVVHAGEVCGTALLNVCGDVMYGSQPFAVLENVVVASHTRRLGLGRTLFQAIERECLRLDCSKLLLMSSVKRADAHRFFEHLGFRRDLKFGFVKYRRAMSIPGGTTSLSDV